ncbi:MAG: prepilin peptidase [Rhodospirillales bacterium]
MDPATPWFAASIVALYIALLAYAAYSDIRRLEVGNPVVAGIMILFFPAAWISGLPLESVVWHAGTGLAVLIAGFVLFSIGLMGGADGKLLAATALWCGTDEIMRLIIYVALAGGILAGIVLAARVLMRSPSLGRRIPWLAEGRWRDAPIPYCAAIAAGAALTFPHTPLMPRFLADMTGY